MPDSPTPNPKAAVSFTVDDALKIVKVLGALTSAISPAQAGAVALVTGAATLLRGTVLPAIQHAHDREMSVAEQAVLAVETAAERARVGAPPATDKSADIVA